MKITVNIIDNSDAMIIEVMFENKNGKRVEILKPFDDVTLVAALRNLANALEQ